MSINYKQLKLVREALLGIFIAVFSIVSNASESTTEIDSHQNSSVSIAVSELAEIKATLSKQEKTIKLLIEKQQSNEEKYAQKVSVELLEKSLGSVILEKAQPKQETRLELRLESIESSLNSMSDKDDYFTYADMAAVAITCVAVLLTIVGLVIAGLAFWGYGEIRELTKTSASKEAKSVAKQTMEEMINSVAKSELEKLIKDGELQNTLQDAVDMILRNDPNNSEKKRTEELLSELDFDESEFDGTESDENFDGDKR
ncbi:hypothetical protein [Vibrio pectenicida]|uniref:Uncharacterized protein n=1 Tax=Vibrio pectenicida TaxID=62763 RepID=A0A427U818_9VIBR|nr:hypothetical protein [Vibrio pectenicida]RSD32817.1 hypothetical protein EJA03_01680 [Vibrio pectenicida]